MSITAAFSRLLISKALQAYLQKIASPVFILLKCSGGLYSRQLQTQYLYQQIIYQYMNLLAHAYLSFNDPDILVGNMISDYVKGKSKFLYPPEIQKGIMLHRAIDEFTDTHAATKEAKEFFRAEYRLYAGACIDVVYDHFLANDTNEFKNEQALKQFSQQTYSMLEKNKIELPAKFSIMLPYMQAQDWLYNYRFRFGIEKSFGGLVRRSAYLTDSAPAFNIFEKHYEELQRYYFQFFPEVKKMAAEWLQNYTNGTKTI